MFGSNQQSSSSRVFLDEIYIKKHSGHGNNAIWRRLGLFAIILSIWRTGKILLDVDDCWFQANIKPFIRVSSSCMVFVSKTLWMMQPHRNGAGLAPVYL
jgi:hypothetical protein